MKVLLVTSLFQPEPNLLKGLDFVEKCKDLGVYFDVLTCMPNYPGGKIYDGYKKKFYLKENVSGVFVYRIPHYVSHDSSAAKRFLSYISFALSASIFVLFKHKYDAVYVYQGPVTLSIPAIIFKFITHKPYILDVQDIWPQSLIGSGMMNMGSGALRMLETFCDFTYKYSDKIIVLSHGYKNAIVSRDIDEEKIEVIHNWCEETACFDSESNANFKFDDNTFNVVYAGNIGALQNLGSVVDAFNILKNAEINSTLYIFGSGIEEAEVKARAKSYALDNVRFMGRLPFKELRPILKQADALLLHLKVDPLTLIGVPQKTQTYLEAGVPLIAALKGDSAQIVIHGRAGVVCEPENPESIASAVTLISGISKAERSEMGLNGVSYYYKNMSFQSGVNRVVSLIKSL